MNDGMKIKQNYVILFFLRLFFFLDKTMILMGDLSCMKNGFQPAPVVSNADIKYLR